MSDDLLERLREVPGAGELFDALEGVPGVWVVGGAVRDALLGRDPRDLDLVVEGDAAEVARRLGEEPLLHERFGTATANGFVNLAAARRERYVRPGALPVSDTTRAYADRVTAAPGVQRWIDAALAEADFLDFEEPYRKAR